ncbi:MAG TPA: hypothetical protein VNK25_05560 [Candidatus Nitrosotenuis sp.]|nr:hypothetical protein [Candidatus Nitrosotenuis sp.]
MPKWKQDETEFTVSVNYNIIRGYQSSIPKPVIDHLNNPKKITFVIGKNDVKVVPATDESFVKQEVNKALKTLVSKRGKK